jgi:hypothetical protein
MGFPFPALRRGLRLATDPARLVRRLLRPRKNAPTELTLEQRAILLADLAQKQARLSEDYLSVRQQMRAARQQQQEKLKAQEAIPPLERLRLLYPWPARRTLEPVNRGWDAGGRDIVLRRLAEERVKIVLEIGSFVGLSTRAWLTAAPEATVICVDPFVDFYHNDFIYRDWPDVVGKSLYDLFLSSCWDFRDRIIPVRDWSPAGLETVAEYGIQPDLIFVDGDHSYESVTADLEASHRLFPKAILTGDDWLWDRRRFPPRSVREAVEDFAAAGGWRIEVRKNTCALDR